MAISGAALNPNAGYHTSTPLAYLLTVFNVRLGWWAGNPRRDESARPGPRIALLSLLSELFALTDSRSAYVNLSDGGHFENLGLYELVRRRCRYIIVADAEEDPHYTFEALGGAIRKCRTDFGVDIKINTDSLRPLKKKPFSAGHCVVGIICYPEKPHHSEASKYRKMCEEDEPDNSCIRGWLVYFKATLTGDEPEDIQQYQASHTAFPHGPTSNQFFSESQFESYRRLGQHVVESTFERVKENLSDKNAEGRLLELFQDLYRKWHPVGGEEKAGDHNKRYCELMQRLANDRELEFVGSQFFPQRPCVAKPASVGGDSKAFFFCLDVIQLMEDVYFDLGFSDKEIRFAPAYAGWMEVFKRWVASEEVQRTWAIAKDTYNKLFQEFFEGLKDGVELARISHHLREKSGLEKFDNGLDLTR